MDQKELENIEVNTKYVIEHSMSDEQYSPVADVIGRAEKIVSQKVTSVPKFERAADLLREVQQMLKVVENHYAPVIQRIKDLLKIAQAEQKEDSEPLETMKGELKKQIEKFYEKEEAAVAAGKRKGNRVDDVNEVMMVANVKVNVEDIEKVPREYLKEVVDEKKLKAAFKVDPRKKIPGISFEKSHSARPNMRAK
jgi:hypothetical protein